MPPSAEERRSRASRPGWGGEVATSPSARTNSDRCWGWAVSGSRQSRASSNSSLISALTWTWTWKPSPAFAVVGFPLTTPAFGGNNDVESRTTCSDARARAHTHERQAGSQQDSKTGRQTEERADGFFRFEEKKKKKKKINTNNKNRNHQEAVGRR